MVSPEVVERAQDLGRKITDYARINLAEAHSKGNLEHWIHANNHLINAASIENFNWIFEMAGFEDYGLDDYLMTGDDQATQKKSAIEARAAQDLYKRLSTAIDLPGKSKIVLKRIRNQDSDWTYRVMLMLPDEDTDWNAVLPMGQSEFPNESVLFYSAKAACINHACDLLYKELRDEHGGVGYVESIGIDELMTQLSGRPEFMDPNTREVGDIGLTVLGAIKGVYSNETNRYAIPIDLLKQAA